MKNNKRKSERIASIQHILRTNFFTVDEHQHDAPTRTGGNVKQDPSARCNSPIRSENVGKITPTSNSYNNRDIPSNVCNENAGPRNQHQVRLSSLGKGASVSNSCCTHEIPESTYNANEGHKSQHQAQPRFSSPGRGTSTSNVINKFEIPANIYNSHEQHSCDHQPPGIPMSPAKIMSFPNAHETPGNMCNTTKDPANLYGNQLRSENLYNSNESSTTHCKTYEHSASQCDTYQKPVPPHTTSKTPTNLNNAHLRTNNQFNIKSTFMYNDNEDFSCPHEGHVKPLMNTKSTSGYNMNEDVNCPYEGHSGSVRNTKSTNKYDEIDDLNCPHERTSVSLRSTKSKNVFCEVDDVAYQYREHLGSVASSKSTNRCYENEHTCTDEEQSNLQRTMSSMYYENEGTACPHEGHIHPVMCTKSTSTYDENEGSTCSHDGHLGNLSNRKSSSTYCENEDMISSYEGHAGSLDNGNAPPMFPMYSPSVNANSHCRSRERPSSTRCESVLETNLNDESVRTQTRTPNMRPVCNEPMKPVGSYKEPIRSPKPCNQQLYTEAPRMAYQQMSFCPQSRTYSNEDYNDTGDPMQGVMRNELVSRDVSENMMSCNVNDTKGGRKIQNITTQFIIPSYDQVTDDESIDGNGCQQGNPNRRNEKLTEISFSVNYDPESPESVSVGCSQNERLLTNTNRIPNNLTNETILRQMSSSVENILKTNFFTKDVRQDDFPINPVTNIVTTNSVSQRPVKMTASEYHSFVHRMCNSCNEN